MSKKSVKLQRAWHVAGMRETSAHGSLMDKCRWNIIVGGPERRLGMPYFWKFLREDGCGSACHALKTLF